MLPSTICFVAGTLGQGGAERQLFYILKSLRQSDVRVSVLCLTRGEFWESKIRDLDIPVFWVGKHQSKAIRMARIISCLRKHPPQVLQSQHTFTNLYVVAAARALGVRDLGALRNSGESEVWNNGRVIGRLNLRAPRSLVVNSRTAMQRALSLGVRAENLHFLPNVVDVEHFKPAGRQRESNQVTLITVGRLVQEKRVDRFLNILSQLRKRSNKTVRGLIVGAGPLKGRLEQQAFELGLLPDAVELMEPVQDTGPIYRQADVLVSTSDFEGTPNVILEAMASGLPVVATRVGGVPEVVSHGKTGYLTEPGDEQTITDALLGLINSAQLRAELGSRAHEYVNANHCLSRLPSLLRGLYDEALS